MSKSSFLFPFVLICCVVFALEKSAVAFAVILAMLIHECGHIIAIKLTGVHVLAIINSAAKNIGVHVSLSLLVSSVCMPSSGIAGS